jgi:putative FmdB family regulatory protein
MPLYEYACANCEHVFEELVIGQEKVECPKCHAANVERSLSLPARPQTATSALPVGGACGEGPPCGAPWCKRTG